MARSTVLTRRLGILFMALMLAVGVVGPVSAHNGAVDPAINSQAAGMAQQPQFCAQCFTGITNLQQKTLFHASNDPGKAMVEMTFDFVGNEASVAYTVQYANAPNPPTPGSYWNAKLEPSSHYENDQYLDAGSDYKFYVKVVDTNGNTYSKVLDFWTT